MRAAAALAAMLAATPGLAERQCGSLAELTKYVTGKEYSERALFDASVKCQRGDCPMKLFGNAETGTWTIIVEVQPGFACILLGGENLAPAKNHEGNPT